MILLLDNYDSFIYNLAQYFGEIGCDVVVRRNNQVTSAEIESMAPSHICISPGPGAPGDAGVSKQIVARFGERTPILGVCLGHQCIGEVYGGKIIRSRQLMHGKAATIYHNGAGLFRGLTFPFQAGRYHSLTVESNSLPSCLEIIAHSDDEEIMAVHHREFPVWGVQFHPESILTPDGKQILRNFLAQDRQ